MAMVLCLSAVVMAAQKEQRHGVIVVGAGIAGLSAAWELEQKNIDVAVIEMAPTYGGTGLTSEGALCIIGTSRSVWAHPPRIEKPPFYALRFMPLTRKSMGGVAIDQSCRVINVSGQTIPGLYAVGELTGLAGVNGKCTLEGTFLGASILTGRVAGRAAAAELAKRKETPH